MSDAHHPDDIFPNGPSSLDPEAISAEITNDKCAITFSAGFLALTTTLGAVEVIPKFIEAAGESDLGKFTEYGVLGVILGGLSVMAIENIRDYRKRLAQAQYNQKLNEIAEGNGIDPSALWLRITSTSESHYFDTIKSCKR